VNKQRRGFHLVGVFKRRMPPEFFGVVPRLSTAPHLSISQKALGTLSDDGNVMPKHVGATRTIHNQ
jgi:hypothetical protein